MLNPLSKYTVRLVVLGVVAVWTAGCADAPRNGEVPTEVVDSEPVDSEVAVPPTPTGTATSQPESPAPAEPEVESPTPTEPVPVVPAEPVVAVASDIPLEGIPTNVGFSESGRYFFYLTPMAALDAYPHLLPFGRLWRLDVTTGVTELLSEYVFYRLDDNKRAITISADGRAAAFGVVPEELLANDGEAEPEVVWPTRVMQHLRVWRESQVAADLGLIYPPVHLAHDGSHLMARHYLDDTTRLWTLTEALPSAQELDGAYNRTEVPAADLVVYSSGDSVVSVNLSTLEEQLLAVAEQGDTRVHSAFGQYVPFSVDGYVGYLDVETGVVVNTEVYASGWVRQMDVDESARQVVFISGTGGNATMKWVDLGSGEALQISWPQDSVPVRSDAFFAGDALYVEVVTGWMTADLYRVESDGQAVLWIEDVCSVQSIIADAFWLIRSGPTGCATSTPDELHLLDSQGTVHIAPGSVSSSGALAGGELLAVVTTDSQPSTVRYDPETGDSVVLHVGPIRLRRALRDGTLALLAYEVDGSTVFEAIVDGESTLTSIPGLVKGFVLTDDTVILRRADENTVWFEVLPVDSLLE